MRVAWGRGAAHGVEEDNGSAGSFTTAEPSERRSHRRAAKGSRTPNPADHQADRAARPTAFFVRPESHTTCVDVVG